MKRQREDAGSLAASGDHRATRHEVDHRARPRDPCRTRAAVLPRDAEPDLIPRMGTERRRRYPLRRSLQGVGSRLGGDPVQGWWFRVPVFERVRAAECHPVGAAIPSPAP